MNCPAPSSPSAASSSSSSCSLLLVTRYKVAGPNQAYIVTGRGQGGPRPRDRPDVTDLRPEGRARRRRLRRAVRAEVHPRPVLAAHPGAVRGAVPCRASSSTWRASRSSRSAAPRTRSARPRSGSCAAGGIVGFTQEVLAGALRSIVGGMTVEEIIRDRAAFAQVAEEAEATSPGRAWCWTPSRSRTSPPRAPTWRTSAAPRPRATSRRPTSPRPTPARPPSRPGSKPRRRSPSPSGPSR